MTTSGQNSKPQSMRDETDSEGVIRQVPKDHPKPPYPAGVPHKFTAEGKVQPFPGNTIVSHLSVSSPLFKPLLALYDKLSKSHLSHLYALLPPSSWHMTLMDGVCDQVRKPGAWPSDLPIDTTLEECNRHFAKKLASFSVQCDPPYQLKIKGFKSLKTGIAVRLEGYTLAEDRRLRVLRNRLAELLQIRKSNHDTYVFHLSLAYLLQHLTKEQSRELSTLLNENMPDIQGAFEIGALEFCFFNDMFAFERQFYLSDNVLRD